MLVGHYLHNVDTKGRVFVPSKYRQDLGQTFYVCPSLDGEPCIRAYSEAQYDALCQKLDEMPMEGNRKARTFYHDTFEVEMDSSGRILLPEEMRRNCGITDKVEVVGMRRWAEFWDPETYENRDSGDEKENKAQLISANIK